MPNQKVPQLPILTAITDADLFYVVDVSDTTDDPTGSSKQVTREEILTNVSYIDFNTTATTTHAEGRVHWNNDLKTLEVDTENPNVHVTVGQELISRVNNQTGGTLLKGRAVYINGQQGQRPTVTYATFTADTTSAGVIGLVAEDINDNSNGYIISYGLIEGVDTSAYSAGTPLYLYTGGTITDVKPQAPDHDVRIGKVIVSNATTGSIFVNIQNGYELDELHDVRITSPTTDDVLVRSSYNGTSVWVNTKTISGLTYVAATTISATTYQNLPVDPNYYVTAFTYSNNVFTIKQTGQSDLTATINSVTGWTVNGNLTVTGNTNLQSVTATTVSATTISGGTYYGDGSNLTGVISGPTVVEVIPIQTSSQSIGTGSNDYYLNYKSPYAMTINSVTFSVATAGSDNVRIGIYRGEDTTATLVGQSSSSTVSTLNTFTITPEVGQNLIFSGGAKMVIGVAVGGTTTNLFGSSCPANNTFAWTNTTDSTGGFPTNPRIKAATRTTFPSIEINTV